MEKVNTGEVEQVCRKCHHSQWLTERGTCKHTWVIEDIGSSVCGCKCEFGEVKAAKNNSVDEVKDLAGVSSGSERQPTCLLPCPFCGNMDLVTITDCMSEDGEWCVYCGSCRSGGAFMREKKNAIMAWNTRTAILE